MNTGTRLVDKQLTLGDKYLGDSKFEKAAAAFNLAIETDPENKEAYIDLSDAYIGLEDFDKAENCLKNGIEKLPEEEDLYIKLAEIYMGNDNDASAIKILDAGYSSTDSKNFESKTEELYIHLTEKAKKQIIGKWMGTTDNYVFSFAKDGTVAFPLEFFDLGFEADINGTYAIDKKAVTITFTFLAFSISYDKTYTFLIKDDSLTLTNIKTSTSTVFTKQAGNG